jgi:ATP-dependent helicase YprA (DUF1998 family)
MDSQRQCEHRSHMPGKGWKRCTYFAVQEAYVETEQGKEFVRLCKKHFDESDQSRIIRTNSFPEVDICPECGSPIEFSKGIPLCSGNHPISGKTQRYFTERYPE